MFVWRTALALALVLALCFGMTLSGCSSDDDAETEATEEAEVVEETEATDEATEDEAADADEGSTASEVDVAPKAILGPTGSDAYTSWAYLKDMYEEDGFWYITVDYITVEGPEEDLQFVNQNPKLRTFPIADTAQLQLLAGSGGSPDYNNVTVAAFDAFQNAAGDELVEVEPDRGWAVRVTQWWAP